MAEDKGFKFDKLGDTYEEIHGASPEPNESAIAAHQAESAEKIRASSGLVDSQGVRFDPALHATNADGEPSKTPLGKWRKKKGVSKVATQSEVALQEQKKQEARAAGRLCADMMVHSAIMLGGPEWTPIGSKEITSTGEYDEHENLRRAFGDYFEAKGISDFPPGIALSIAVSGYMMPRFIGGPETKARVSNLKLWMRGAWQKLKSRSRKNAAQSDTRNDGTRKDDTSKTASDAGAPQATRSPRT